MEMFHAIPSNALCFLLGNEFLKFCVHFIRNHVGRSQVRHWNMARGIPKHETPLVPTGLQSQQERKREGKVDQGGGCRQQCRPAVPQPQG